MGFAQQLGQSLATSSATSAASGLIGSAFSALAAHQQYKNNKKLMAQQNQYAIDAFNRENERQDYLLRNQLSMQKEGLKNAGYSTADPNGTGVQAASVNSLEAPSNPSVSVQPQFPDVSGSAFLALANARKVNADARLSEIEAKYRARILAGNLAKIETELEVYRDQLHVNLDLAKQELANKGQQFDLNDLQIKQAAVTLDSLSEQLKIIKVDAKYKEQLTDSELKRLKQDVYNLAKDGEVKKLCAELAEFGIIANADGMTNLFGILAKDSSGKIMQALGDSIASLIEGLPGLLADIFTSVIDGFEKHAKSKVKGLWEKGKKFIHDAASPIAE